MPLRENYEEWGADVMKKRLTLHDKAFLALKKAVRGVVKRHRESGRPLAVWKDGKVVRLPADQI